MVIKDSSSEEDLQDANKSYHTTDQTLGEIQQELMHTPDLIKEVCKCKQKVDEYEVGTCSKPSEIDEDPPAHPEMMKSVSEVEVLKKSLQYFK